MLIWKIALQTIFLYIGSQALEQLEDSVFSTSQQSRTKVLVFFKLHFIDYAITVVLIVPPLPASTQHPHSLRQSPHHCSCPWVMSVSSLAAPFPVLYFTSHGYSVTTYLYFLIPSPLYPFSHTPFPYGNLPVTNFSCF